jgi:hypothetical protein
MPNKIQSRRISPGSGTDGIAHENVATVNANWNDGVLKVNWNWFNPENRWNGDNRLLLESFCFSPVYFGRVFCSRYLCQPASILLTSTNFSEREINFFSSNSLLSHAMWRKSLSMSVVTIAFSTTGIFRRTF